MMIVTGATTFLGSCMISKLNQHNFNYIVAVDDFISNQSDHLKDKIIQERVQHENFMTWLQLKHQEVEFLFHCNYIPPASDDAWHEQLRINQDMIKELWEKCIAYQIPFLFCEQTDASQGSSLKTWIEQQTKTPFFWACLELPLVYGPGEDISKEKASWVYQCYLANIQKQAISLPRQEARSYVYAKDITALAYHLVHHRKYSGYYQIQTQKTYTPQEVKTIVDKALSNTLGDSGMAEKPAALEAMHYPDTLTSLEQGIQDYVKNHLQKDQLA